MKAIIVTHRTMEYKCLVYGIDYEHLSLLAELRYLNKKSIKKLYKTVNYSCEADIYKIVNKHHCNVNKISLADYRKEVLTYFSLK